MNDKVVSDNKPTILMTIHSIGNLMRRINMQSNTVKECEELTNMHGYVLGYLTRKVLDGEEVYQKDVEEMFEIRRSSATEMLQLMEKNGLITREVSDTDKRMKKIVITQKSWEIHLRATQECASAERTLKQGLSPSEKSELLRLLEKVKENAQSMLDTKHARKIEVK